MWLSSFLIHLTKLSIIWILTTAFFITVVTTIIAVITLLKGIHTPLSIGTTKLIKCTWYAMIWSTAFFIPFVSTVKISITFFFFRQTWWWCIWLTMEVTILTSSVSCWQYAIQFREMCSTYIKRILQMYINCIIWEYFG